MKINKAIGLPVVGYGRIYRQHTLAYLVNNNRCEVYYNKGKIAGDISAEKINPALKRGLCFNIKYVRKKLTDIGFYRLGSLVFKGFGIDLSLRYWIV